jgi:hypothetical protein
MLGWVGEVGVDWVMVYVHVSNLPCKRPPPQVWDGIRSRQKEDSSGAHYKSSSETAERRSW